MRQIFPAQADMEQHTMTNLGAVQGDGIAGIDSLDMAVMGRGLSHALGDQAMSMSIDDIGFSERG